MTNKDVRHLTNVLPEAFSVREALMNQDVSRKMLRSPKLCAPWFGARTKSESDQTNNLVALVKVAPQGAFFSHLTAAVLWGLPLPNGEVAESALTKPHVSVRSEQFRLRRKGVRAHRLQVRDDELTRRFGLPLTTVARTWLDASELLGLPDLLAMTDYIFNLKMSWIARWRRCNH